MVEFKNIAFYDRIPKYPGRVKLLPVSGQSDIYDLTRADEPIQEGTKLDKIFFESFRRRAGVLYITESQDITIPDGVHIIDVYLVNGGSDGNSGGDYANGGTDPYASVGGGTGGTGGASFYIPGVRVKPGDVCQIIVGAVNGGITSFNGMSHPNTDGASGGVYVSGYNRTAQGDGKIPKLIGQLDNLRCPIDGKYYGVSGAAGGGTRVLGRNDGAKAATGGEAAVINADGVILSPPKQGYYAESTYNNTSNDNHIVGGGGGGSLDNPGTGGSIGQKGSVIAKAGNGGDAVTYGCGGGGGAGTYGNYTTGGKGGKGAQGVCIIAY